MLKWEFQIKSTFYLLHSIVVNVEPFSVLALLKEVMSVGWSVGLSVGRSVTHTFGMRKTADSDVFL